MAYLLEDPELQIEELSKFHCPKQRDNLPRSEIISVLIVALHKALHMEFTCLDRRVLIDPLMHKMAREQESLARLDSISFDAER